MSLSRFPSGAAVSMAAALFCLGAPSAAPADARLTGYLQLGPEYLGGEALATAEPGVLLETRGLSLQLAAPLRLVLQDPHGTPAGRLRVNDWDDPSDAGRILRKLEFSAGERTVSGTLGALAHRSAGHGTILNGYGDLLDADRMPLGATARAAVGPVSAEALASDLLAPGVLGGIIAVDPFLGWEPMSDRAHLSASYYIDRWAPTDRGSPMAAIYGAGLDLVAWRGGTFKLSPYFDANARGQGWGLHAGMLAGFSLAGGELSMKAEWRRAKSPYQPEYFDFAYAVERWNSGGASRLSKRDVAYPTANLWRVETRFESQRVTGALSAGARARGLVDASAVASAEFGQLDFSAFVAARPDAAGRWPGRLHLLAEGRYRFAGYFFAFGRAGRQYRSDGGRFTEPAALLAAGLGAAAAL